MTENAQEVSQSQSIAYQWRHEEDCKNYSGEYICNKQIQRIDEPRLLQILQNKKEIHRIYVSRFSKILQHDQVNKVPTF